MHQSQTPRQELVDDLVLANAILAAQGIVDGFGHVSARCVDEPDLFLMARSMAPGLVQRTDIMLHDLAGEPRDDARTPYLERFIHSEIYAANPQVMAVVHSHSAAMIAFGCVPTATLQPVYHMAAFLGRGVARFEIRESGGDATDMLIRTPRLGKDVAASLGDHALVLMRGHGSTVVGNSLRQAVYRAVYGETNARLQLDALRLGTPTFLNAREARAAEGVADQQMGRAWDLWCRAIRGGGGPS